MAEDRYSIAADVIGLLEEPLATHGFELLDVRVFQGGGRLTLRIYVDTDEGISISGCAQAARTAGMLLEEADIIRSAYVIEVSSPGVRRPLRKAAHYAAAVDQDVNIKVVSDKGSRFLKGKLVDADETGVSILTAAAQEEAGDDAKPERIAFTEIREANLDPVLDVQALINADRRQRKEKKKQAREARRGRK